MEKSVFIDRWNYVEPDLSPDKEGNVVLILKMSFGPLEVFEWGLDKNNHPYASYKWLENDFYENENYCITISKEALMKQIDITISQFAKYGLSEWVDLYEKINQGLNQTLF